jgi:hypothetical protein
LQSKSRPKGAIYTGVVGGGAHPLLVQTWKAYVACFRVTCLCDMYFKVRYEVPTQESRLFEPKSEEDFGSSMLKSM